MPLGVLSEAAGAVSVPLRRDRLLMELTVLPEAPVRYRYRFVGVACNRAYKRLLKRCSERLTTLREIGSTTFGTIFFHAQDIRSIRIDSVGVDAVRVVAHLPLSPTCARSRQPAKAVRNTVKVMSREFLSVNASSQRFHIAAATLRRAIKAGELPAYRPGERTVYLDPAEVIGWLKSQRLPTAREAARDIVNSQKETAVRA